MKILSVAQVESGLTKLIQLEQEVADAIAKLYGGTAEASDGAHKIVSPDGEHLGLVGLTTVQTANGPQQVPTIIETGEKDTVKTVKLEEHELPVSEEPKQEPVTVTTTEQGNTQIQFPPETNPGAFSGEPESSSSSSSSEEHTAVSNL